MASRSIAVVLILSCALLGGYASLGLVAQSGFMKAVGECVRISYGRAGPDAKCLVNRAHEFSRMNLTGIHELDHPFALLVEFFALGAANQNTDGRPDVQALVTSGYMATLFFGAWYLMALEGLRKRNRGGLLSYTGIFGLLFQSVTVTVIGPIYLALHILGLPESQDYDTITVDSVDLGVLPWVTIISYIVPTIALGLPAINNLSAKANYTAIALWQPFPLYQSILHPILRFVCGGSDGGKQSVASLRKSLGRVYRWVIAVCMGVHVAVIATIVVNSQYGLYPNLSASEVLGATSLTHPPTLAMASPPVSSLDARNIVASFLRWDIYCTSAAFVFWAGYLAYSVKNGPGMVAILEKTFFWTVVGGPISAASILLWERDSAVLRNEEASQAPVKRR